MTANHTGGFPRQLSNELLDNLAPDDPRAMRSRADLRRINRIMGSAALITQALNPYATSFWQRQNHRPLRIIELGAGDGSLMLRLAKKRATQWPEVHLTLLDRQDLLDASTLHEFQRLGWTVDILCIDVNEWMASSAAGRWDVAIANLFIHHFSAPQITALFDVLSQRCNRFMAFEPRRGYLPLLASRLVGFIGANAVTREDAVLSVRAGFAGRELSSLWPASSSQWVQTEYAAGLFGHSFVAIKDGADS